MSSPSRLQKRTFLFAVILVPFTALSIYLVYGHKLFLVWPWLRFSISMSILTYLWAYTFWFVRITRIDTDLHPLLLILIVIPIDSIIVYPESALGLTFDTKLQALVISLELIHGFGFFLIQREIKIYLKIKNIF